MIDTHQHLIYPELFRYPWLAKVPNLCGKAFTLEDYRHQAEEGGIVGSLFMEVDVAPDQSSEEARFFCQLSENPDHRILGVIAACRPESGQFAKQIEEIAHTALKGFRRILYDQPDDYSQTKLFRENLAQLGRLGMTFDMCFLARQLTLAVELADACPDTRLMLDHCGVPDIAGGAFESWRKSLRELSLRPNVYCKLSGLVAYATRDTANAKTLRPWVEHVLECFGSERIVWGGDWPVCNLTSTLSDWARITRELLKNLSKSEHERIFHANAREFYQLASL